MIARNESSRPSFGGFPFAFPFETLGLSVKLLALASPVYLYYYEIKHSIFKTAQKN